MSEVPSRELDAAAATSEPQATRRDFLYITTATFAGVGAAAAAVPLFSQMEPDASTLAAGGPVDIDLKTAAPGQNIIALWRQRPISFAPPAGSARDFAVDQGHRFVGRPALACLAAATLRGELASLYQAGISGVLWSICTHLGCLPKCSPERRCRPNRWRLGRAAISARATDRNTILRAGSLGRPGPLQSAVPALPLCRRGQSSASEKIHRARKLDFDSIVQL